MALPYGWTDRYALEHCMQEIANLTAQVQHLTHEIEQLKATKQDRKGRRPSKPLSGDSGPPIARG